MREAVFYDRSRTHDALLVKWFCEIATNGDLANLFSPAMQELGMILSYFQRESRVIFQMRGGRIIRLAWWEPVMSGAFFGCWVDISLRGRVETINWLEAVCRVAFETYPVLIAMTKQEKLLDVMQRFGYTVLGPVPSLWQGETAWVLTLVQEDLPHGKKLAVSTGADATR